LVVVETLFSVVVVETLFWVVEVTL